jgi:hypothetical protein
MALKRTHIGIFGTNNTAGTTADIKVTVMQFHSLGPVKLMDTAGIDESTGLGIKKRAKTFRALRECDIVLITVDPFRSSTLDFPEKELFSLIEKTKQVFIIFNYFSSRNSEQEFNLKIQQFKTALDEFVIFNNSGSNIDKSDKSALLPHNNSKIKAFFVSADLNASYSRRIIVDLICEKAKKAGKMVPLIPDIRPDRFILMVIPMDEETPEGRLLRPQALALENSIRNFAPVVCFRPDLGLARKGTLFQQEEEKNRYLELVNYLSQGPCPLQLVITDSQAMDVIGPWTPAQTQLTTFSIMMINRQLDNNITSLVKGAQALLTLKDGDKILILEACNHDRKAEDIGTVQIPELMKKRLNKYIIFEHAFGREFPFERLCEFKAAIHCGGCMVEPQKVADRIKALIKADIPVTNYGIALTFLKSPDLIEKVTRPFMNN